MIKGARQPGDGRGGTRFAPPHPNRQRALQPCPREGAPRVAEAALRQVVWPLSAKPRSGCVSGGSVAIVVAGRRS